MYPPPSPPKSSKTRTMIRINPIGDILGLLRSSSGLHSAIRPKGLLSCPNAHACLAQPSAHRFRLLSYGPDRGELIGGQRLLGKQQAAAFVEVGAPCAQDGSRLLEGLRDDIAHRHVDLALSRLGGFDAAGRSPQEWLRRG